VGVVTTTTNIVESRIIIVAISSKSWAMGAITAIFPYLRKTIYGKINL
jgi:hypothetical protein